MSDEIKCFGCKGPAIKSLELDWEKGIQSHLEFKNNKPVKLTQCILGPVDLDNEPVWVACNNAKPKGLPHKVGDFAFVGYMDNDTKEQLGKFLNAEDYRDTN